MAFRGAASPPGNRRAAGQPGIWGAGQRWDTGWLRYPRELRDTRDTRGLGDTREHKDTKGAAS